MKKTLKVLLISLFGLIIIFLVSIGFVWVNQDKIKQYAVKQLNEQLTAPITVGSIDITFIDQFPRVSLLFNDISIADPIRSKRNLLQAKRLFIAFNINDIITQQYNIKLIEADSGYCHLFVNNEGKVNYNIVKPSSNSNDDLFLELKHIQLSRMNIVYENLRDQKTYGLVAHNILLSGNFKGKQESLSASGLLHVNQLKTGSLNLIKDKEIEVDIAMKVDEAKSLYTFTKGNIQIGTLDLECKGSIENKKRSTLLDITFNANKLAITDLLELLPGQLSRSISQYKSEGNIYFNGLVKGEVSSKNRPEIKLQFGVENGKLTASEQHISINHINCKGEFSNGVKHNLQSAYIILPALHFQLGDGLFNGALTINNFTNPFIDLALKGNTSLSDLIQFTQSKWIDKADGSLQFDVSIKGLLRNLQSAQGFLGTETSGHITCDATNVVFKKGNKNIERIQTDFSLTGKDLTINNFKASIDKSDITISGSLKNIVPYLLAQKQTLTADINYKSDFINLEHIILPIPQSSGGSSTFTLPQFISVNANVSVAKLIFHDFTANNVNGNLNWKGKKIETQGLHCQTMKGSVSIKGQVENASDGRFLVSSTIDSKQVDMYELFKQCNNFGQAEITDKNIRGTLTATTDLLGVWSANLNCDIDKLYAKSNIHITNGELVNYRTLDALSKYISLDDLHNLKFADLKNTIEIQNKTIIIPSMDVENNALNLSVAGTHTFDNYLDYHLKIRLGDLLSKKYKKRSNEFEEETTESGTSLFISMKGPADNLKFSYDKKQAREKAKEELKKERESVKTIWRKELGLDKDESIKEKKTDSDELEFEPE